IYDGTDKVLFTISTVVISWVWFFFLAISGKMIGNIDKTGKYIMILNKVSAIIILIVAVMILKQLIMLLL
ncbi:MAG: LysE family transporter, partial [Staphylococcus equorum]|nr:LysE family transporter [Staphylococcus equorum]